MKSFFALIAFVAFVAGMNNASAAKFVQRHRFAMKKIRASFKSQSVVKTAASYIRTAATSTTPTGYVYDTYNPSTIDCTGLQIVYAYGTNVCIPTYEDDGGQYMTIVMNAGELSTITVSLFGNDHSL
jgi:hypothetical protein